jgi:predicted dehydrogenase
MNRREFVLGSAALASSAPAMSARSYAAILGANDRVGLGVIGTGRRATIVCDGFAEDARVEFRALADVYDKQLDGFQTHFKQKVAQAATMVEYQRMLDRKEIDAVLIATPDHLHVPIAKAALGAHKHTYLEKPTLHRWSEHTELANSAANGRCVLQCGMQQRSGSHYKKVRDEIFATGKLGQVVLVRAVWHNFPWQRRNIKNEPQPAGLRWDLFLGPAPKLPYETARYSSWRSYHDYGNGLLADILTHWADVAQWMQGDSNPLSAVALGGDFKLSDGRDNPDTVSAVVRYRSWNLNFESSVLSIRNDRPSVFFEGTEGTLDLTREGYTLTMNGGEPQTVVSAESLERAHTANFIDAIVRGEKPNAPLDDGLAASRPVLMALASYWEQKIGTQGDLA